MTAYNREHYIAAAIEAVLRSTFVDFELIVVDDGSSDGTLAVARHYAATDPRVRVYANETNVGDYPNRNRAASYARGTYVKYVDSDDVIYPHGLDVMVRCMEAFPSAGFGLSEWAFADVPHPRLLRPLESYTEHFLTRDLFGRAPGSAIIRRTAFEAVGGFSGRRQVGDHELWLTLARRFELVTMPTDLVWDRSHGQQEKAYDSPGQKDAQHHEIALAALAAPDCPLDTSARRLAERRLTESRARNLVAILLGRGGIREAWRYRAESGLPFADAARYVVSRLAGADA